MSMKAGVILLAINDAKTFRGRRAVVRLFRLR